MGQPVRYNGSKVESNEDVLTLWQNEGRLVHYCPEISVGFPIPRPPAEIIGGDARLAIIGETKVLENNGNDVTQMFVEGAQNTLMIAQKNNVQVAVLTDGSPSCGSTFTYDGSFSGGTVDGKGVTAELLSQNQIKIFAEHQMLEADEYIRNMEKGD